MNTHTIRVAATATIVLTLVLGVLGTSPSTPNGVSYINISEGSPSKDTERDAWSWILKPPTRFGAAE